ncbi:MAG: 50S ribosomal protein L29 [candidate division WOR-3 bacterium]
MGKKARDIRELTPKERATRLRELKDEYFKLRIAKQLGHVEQFHKFKEIRREIARVMTIMREERIKESKR